MLLSGQYLIEQDYESFDSDGAIAVVDNCANRHIWNNREDFVTYKPLDKVSQVATIGGANHYPVGIGLVRIQVPDDAGMTSSIVMNDVLYFPNSPVKIISVMCLGDDLNDSSGTWITTKRFESLLKWDCKQYSKKITHPRSRLPELIVNPGCSSDMALCTALDTVRTTHEPHTLETVLPEDIFDASDEVQSHSLAASVTANNTANDDKSSTEPTHDKILSDESVIATDYFQVGDAICYTKDDLTGIVTILKINFGSAVRGPMYKIQMDNSGHIWESYKEFIFPLDVPNIAETNIRELREINVFSSIFFNFILLGKKYIKQYY